MSIELGNMYQAFFAGQDLNEGTEFHDLLHCRSVDFAHFRGFGQSPNCIESGERAVSKILGDWGMSLAEDHVEEKRYY